MKLIVFWLIAGVLAYSSSGIALGNPTHQQLPVDYNNLMVGTSALLGGQCQAALNTFEQIAPNPGIAGILALRQYQAYACLGNMQAALVQLQVALTSADEHFIVLAYLNQIMRHDILGIVEPTHTVLAEQTELEPANASLWFTRAFLYQVEGDWEKVNEYFSCTVNLLHEHLATALIKLR
ncbi:hypothetical protein HC928_06560 [bacterium]|nr:hypothetical protein [bacterium]